MSGLRLHYPPNALANTELVSHLNFSSAARISTYHAITIIVDIPTVLFPQAFTRKTL
jgi:hypothetical protein